MKINDSTEINKSTPTAPIFNGESSARSVVPDAKNLGAIKGRNYDFFPFLSLVSIKGIMITNAGKGFNQSRTYARTWKSHHQQIIQNSRI